MLPKNRLIAATGIVSVLLILAVVITAFPTYAQEIDGTASATGNNVSSVSMTLTTADKPDVLFLAVSYSKPFDTVSTITTGCSADFSTAFTLLTVSSQGSVKEELWYAVTNTTLSSCSITVTMTGSEYFQASVFGLFGPASTTSPFDGSAVTTTGTGTTASASITTADQNDVILGFVAATSSPSFNWLPYTGVVTSSGSGNTSVSSGDRVTTTSSGTYSIATTLSASEPWAMIAVAVNMLGASGTESFTLINPITYTQPNASNSESFTLTNPVIHTQPNGTGSETFSLITPCANISVQGVLTLDTCQAIATVYGETQTSSPVGVKYVFIGTPYTGALSSSLSKFTVDQKSLFTVNSSIVWTVDYNVSYVYVSQHEAFQAFSNVSLSSLADSATSFNFTCSSSCNAQVYVPSWLNVAPYRVLDNGQNIQFSYNGATRILSFNAASPVSILFFTQSNGGSGGTGGTPTSTSCTINCSPSSGSNSTSTSQTSPSVNVDLGALATALHNPFFDLFLLLIAFIIFLAATTKRRGGPSRSWQQITKPAPNSTFRKLQKELKKKQKDLFG